jgi:hypothetical protein
VIEIDGEVHFTPENKDHDQARTQRLEGYGLSVVRFTNEQVLKDFQQVCEQLNKLIFLMALPADALKSGGQGNSEDNANLLVWELVGVNALRPQKSF